MFSEPVIGEKFFGRQDVLDLLNKRVSALREGYRQNIALTGQSLAGKSSIIQHFLYTLKEDDFIPLYVEVIKEPLRSFANKFLATLLYSALTKLGEEVDVDMDSLLEKSSERLPKTYLAIKDVNLNIERDRFDEAYMGLLGLTSVLKAESGMSCIVIFDEFDNLELLGIKNPFLNFGKVIMVQKDTMYIVSSSRNQAIKKILSEKLSLLFGNFEIVKILGFDLKTAGEFLDLRLAGFDLEDGMKKFIIAFTDGNPFYLDKIAGRAKEIAIERMSSYIDRQAVSVAVLDTIYNANGIIHQYLLNYILELLDTRHKEGYMTILASIASGRNKQSEISRHLKTRQGEISKGLARLAELGLLSKNGVFHRIDDPILGFWLKFVYQRRKELVVDCFPNRMGLFGKEIDSYLDSFARELERPIITKLEQLFDRFSNELVQIESRYIRLPHFTKVEAKTFPDSKPFLAATFRGNSWVVQPYEEEVSENDIIDYVRNLKTLELKISNRVIAPLKGIDENAKLLAKELKISIWDVSVVNMLLGFYGRDRIIIL